MSYQSQLDNHLGNHGIVYFKQASVFANSGYIIVSAAVNKETDIDRQRQELEQIDGFLGWM